MRWEEADIEGKVLMSQEELRRARLLEHAVEGKTSLREVPVALGISYRQAKRLKKRYLEAGPAGLVHGNRGRSVAHAVPKELVQTTVALHGQTYADFNDTHSTELLAEIEHIHLSRESVRRILRRAGRPPKRTRRPPRHRSRSPRMPIRGMMVQRDGSPHHWFGSLPIWEQHIVPHEKGPRRRRRGPPALRPHRRAAARGRATALT